MRRNDIKKCTLDKKSLIDSNILPFFPKFFLMSLIRYLGAVFDGILQIVSSSILEKAFTLTICANTFFVILENFC